MNRKIDPRRDFKAQVLIRGIYPDLCAGPAETDLQHAIGQKAVHGSIL